MTTKKRLLFSYGILAVLLAVLFAANLFWGSVALTPEAVLSALLGRGQDALSVRIITQLRLPRAVMVVLLGAALSAAGYLLQTFFANPIAGPFVMGISSGAKLAVALVMVVFLNQGLLTSSLTLILAAFAGAMAAMAFVLAVSRRVQRMSILVICGVMIGYICSAITEFVVAFAQDSNIVNLHNWSQGSFSGMTWGNVRAAALVVLPALAAALGLPRLSIEKFETGRQTPSQEQQQKLAGAFGVSLPYLRGETDDPTSMDNWLSGAVPQEDVVLPKAVRKATAAVVAQSGDSGRSDGAVFSALLKSDSFKALVRETVLDVLKSPEGQALLAKAAKK